MGSKDKGKKEAKKPPKPKAKATPNVHSPIRKINDYSPAAGRTGPETT